MYVVGTRASLSNMRVRLGLLAALVVLLGMGVAGSAATGGAQVRADDPVVMAAGDIACNSAGTGKPGATCSHPYTAGLLVDQRDNGAGGLSAVLAIGDNQYFTASLFEFDSYFDKSWGRVKSLIHPVPGDSEYDTDPAADGYYTYFGAAAGQRGKGWYSFDLGAWHLVALNIANECRSVKCDTKSAQIAWLKADLASSGQPCTLAYWHEPRSEGSYAQPALDALARAKADVVLNGHHHTYRTADPANGIRQFTVGTGGRHGPITGVLKLVLRPGAYEWEFVGHGTTSKGSGTCNAKATGGSPPPPAPTPPPAAPTPPASPPAASPRIVAIADTYVSSASAGKAYGKKSDFRIQRAAKPKNATYRSYLKFDVPALTGTVMSATLVLRARSSAQDGGTLFEVADQWDEKSLTWSSAPALGALDTPVGSAGRVSKNTDVAIQLDLSKVVLTSGSTLSLALATDATTSVKYCSRDSKNKSCTAPALVVSTAS